VSGQRGHLCGSALAFWASRRLSPMEEAIFIFLLGCGVLLLLLLARIED
jgi:hypothetical protein